MSTKTSNRRSNFFTLLPTAAENGPWNPAPDGWGEERFPDAVEGGKGPPGKCPCACENIDAGLTDKATPWVSSLLMVWVLQMLWWWGRVGLTNAQNCTTSPTQMAFCLQRFLYPSQCLNMICFLQWHVHCSQIGMKVIHCKNLIYNLCSQVLMKHN